MGVYVTIVLLSTLENARTGLFSVPEKLVLPHDKIPKAPFVKIKIINFGYT
jgi:hypothetical protein